MENCKDCGRSMPYGVCFHCLEKDYKKPERKQTQNGYKYDHDEDHCYICDNTKCACTCLKTNC